MQGLSPKEPALVDFVRKTWYNEQHKQSYRVSTRCLP